MQSAWRRRSASEGRGSAQGEEGKKVRCRCTCSVAVRLLTLFMAGSTAQANAQQLAFPRGSPSVEQRVLPHVQHATHHSDFSSAVSSVPPPSPTLQRPSFVLRQPSHRLSLAFPRPPPRHPASARSLEESTCTRYMVRVLGEQDARRAAAVRTFGVDQRGATQRRAHVHHGPARVGS